MIATILPTDSCNLDCVYCVSRKGNHKMTKNTLYNTLDFVYSVYNELDEGGHIEWHAAEPMTMPISFYEDAEKHLKNINSNIKRIMCTNLTLANNEWYDFFEKYDYSISTSLDGDMYLHDHNMGIGTFEKTIKALVELKKRNISYGCIAVMSLNTCLHSKEVYPFFKVIGDHIKINIESPNKFNTESLKCFIQIFDDWYNDENRIEMDPFDDMGRFIMGFDTRKCYVDCNRYVVCIDTFGDVYPCESFVVNSDTSNYIIGNVNTDNWKDIWYGEKRKKFLEFQDNILDECKECKYVKYCSGGCAADSVLIGNTKNKMGSTCDIIKPLMDHIAKRIGA